MISEKEYNECRAKMEDIISRGTELGDMELLCDEDKEEYTRLVGLVDEYENAYYPLPGYSSTLLTDAIKEKMVEKGVNQRQTAKLLGISESRVSDLLSGKRKLNLNIAKRLRDNLGLSADFILDMA